jgi:hypothetical protein
MYIFIPIKNDKIYGIIKNLSCNGISDEGAEKIGEEISKLQNLTSLYLNLR